ncbi:MAG: ribose-5-phosphate isomerase RpiA [Bdellovibrionales bacterium]|nr:ribose-5-phosphate isomerase RpiA [Bdellovibrionales bacterium]
MDNATKEELGVALASRVKGGQLIGVGTGSTVEAVLVALGKRVATEGLQLSVVPTSYQSAWSCEKLGFQVLSPATRRKLDWAFDGADEVDPTLRLLKGRGAALYHEKLIAARAEEFVVVVSEDKLVQRLGEKMAVPVEVTPESVHSVEKQLVQLGAERVELRYAVALERTVPLFTQEGNLILDAQFANISDDFEKEINGIPGAVENGIFTHYATEVLVGASGGVRSLTRKG